MTRYRYEDQVLLDAFDASIRNLDNRVRDVARHEHKYFEVRVNAAADGVTDDYTALQKAIDRAQLAVAGGYFNGGRVLVGPGRHRITETLMVEESRISIEGMGAATEIYNDTAGATKPTLVFQGTFGTPLARCNLSDLMLASNFAGDGHLLISFTSESFFTDLHLFQCNGDGLVNQDVSIENRFTRVHVLRSGGHNFVFRDNSNGISVVGCRSHNSQTETGMFFDTLSQPAYGIYIAGSVFEGNAKEGILVGGSSNVRALVIDGCYFELNNAGGVASSQVKVLNTVNAFTGFRIEGCHFTGTSTVFNEYPIDLQTGTNGHIGPNHSEGHAISDLPNFGTAALVQGITVQDFVYGLRQRGTNANTKNSGYWMHNPAAGGEVWALLAGIPGISESGVVLRNETTGVNRRLWPSAAPTVTGSRGGNAALASLLTTLANLGEIVDGTTP